LQNRAHELGVLVSLYDRRSRLRVGVRFEEGHCLKSSVDGNCACQPNQNARCAV